MSARDAGFFVFLAKVQAENLAPALLRRMTTNPYLPSDHDYENDTPAVRLRICRAAICAIEGGAQSYRTPDGHELTRGNLKTLYDQEKRLMAIADDEDNGPAINYAELKK